MFLESGIALYFSVRTEKYEKNRLREPFRLGSLRDPSAKRHKGVNPFGIPKIVRFYKISSFAHYVKFYKTWHFGVSKGAEPLLRVGISKGEASSLPFSASLVTFVA